MSMKYNKQMMWIIFYLYLYFGGREAKPSIAQEPGDPASNFLASLTVAYSKSPAVVKPVNGQRPHEPEIKRRWQHARFVH